MVNLQFGLGILGQSAWIYGRGPLFHQIWLKINIQIEWTHNKQINAAAYRFDLQIISFGSVCEPNVCRLRITHVPMCHVWIYKMMYTHTYDGA